MCDDWQFKNAEVMWSRSHGKTSSVPKDLLQVYDRHVFKDIEHKSCFVIVWN